MANVFVHVTAGLDGRSFPGARRSPSSSTSSGAGTCRGSSACASASRSQVRNSDPLLHNVRANSAVNEPFNQGQPVQGMHYAHTFSTAEVMVPMKCDVHAWMNAWIGVVDHPYFAVTGADGAFTLANLPAGQLHRGSVARGRRHAVRHGDRHRARARRRCRSPSRRPRHERHARAHALGDDAGRGPGGRAVAVGVRADYVALTKPRLNLLVVMTTLVAYYVGRRAGAPLAELVHTVVGTTLVAAGASALNQVWEKDTDKLMRRTRRRPLPDARLAVAPALWFGVAAHARRPGRAVALHQPAGGDGGARHHAHLRDLVHAAQAALVALDRSSARFPGALPALIGWAAATNTLSLPGWGLFAIVFMWQMPHFLAIAWMYRDDYARAGMPLLPVIEPDGRSTGRQAVLYAAAMIPVSLLPTAHRPGRPALPRRGAAARRDRAVAGVRVRGHALARLGAAAVLRDDHLPAAVVDRARARPRGVAAR